MNSWEYYSEVGVEYPDRFRYRDQLKKIIDETPMTTAQRCEALKEIPAKITVWYNEAIKPYNEAQKRLEEEFWDDAREELGYMDFLPLKAAQILEAKAWRDGHANGYSEVFGHLSELVEFLNDIDIVSNYPNSRKAKLL